MSHKNRRIKTVGWRVFRPDGTKKRYQTRREAANALLPNDRLARIKRNHNGTVWHEYVE